MTACFVVGTDTGVGKTHVSCALLQALAQHHRRVVGMKPVAAGVVPWGEGWASEDSIALRAASTIAVPPELDTPVLLPDPLSPHIAATRAGVQIDIAAIVQAYRARLEKTLQELLAEQEIDETRIIQETALYADKVNYTEEVVRLGSHFQQFRAILESADGPIGRKLDFLIQELHREANTLGSKSAALDLTRISVDMKVLIEQMREQVQNIE